MFHHLHECLKVMNGLLLRLNHSIIPIQNLLVGKSFLDIVLFYQGVLISFHVF